MEASVFITRLKADSPEKYKSDLRQVLEEFKLILNKLFAKDRGLFVLNVLRTLCWNIDNAPKWRDNVDYTSLLTLAIDSTRFSALLDREDQVKTLACFNHLHKHVTRLNKSIPPNLVLHLSAMPFLSGAKNLLKDYHKTYWHILTDRIAYIERLQTKLNIHNLLPILIEDIIKVIQIYDTVQFCSSVIVFLFKKLHLLYSFTDPHILIKPFKQIFSALNQKDDVAKLKELPEKEILELYMKLNDCLYVVADNSSKMCFKDGTLTNIVQNCIALVGHRKDLLFCLETFNKKLFCKIVFRRTSMSSAETLFGSFEEIFQNANQLGYDKAMLATYPYLNQLLRLYIEYHNANEKKLSETIQKSCLNLILFITRKLKDCNQLLECENCLKKTGIHDALRLSSLIKNLTHPGQNENILETLYLITKEQYVMLAELRKIGCPNYQKYFRKLQSEVHNTAISLNKSKLYATSIKLFDIYLKNEIKCKEINNKNISRALFNRSICQLDFELYEKALIDAFLSIIYAQQEGLSEDKYMSVVVDVKASELKSRSDDEELDSDRLQLVTIVDACKMAMDSEMYGDLSPFLAEQKFSALLRHEFASYYKLCQSEEPVAGVWRALHSRARAERPALGAVESKAAILEVLYDVILETPSVVWTIHNTYFSTIVGELLDDFDNMTTLTSDEKLVHASLLFLQCEYDLAAASQKYKWKFEKPGDDSDSLPSTRTIPQEHAAARRAVAATQLLRDLLPSLPQAPPSPRLGAALRLAQVFVPQLQLLRRDAQALQLAKCCCMMAEVVGDRESYLRNAGVLLSSSLPSPDVARILDRAVRWERERWGEIDIIFLCDIATYYQSQGNPRATARLVRAAREKIIELGETQPDLDCELAVGRVLETQELLSGSSAAGPGALAVSDATLHHYFDFEITGDTWSSCHLRSLTLRWRSVLTCTRTVSLAQALGLGPRARSAAVAMTVAPAPARAGMIAESIDIQCLDSALVNINQHLKNILGLQPSDETQPSSLSDTQKQPLFTPRQELETMRNNLVLRNQTSPCDIISSVPAFKIPDFFHHHLECACYACEIPVCLQLACKTSSIEAAMLAFTNEKEIARNYFQGVFNMIHISVKKLKKIRKTYLELYDEFIVESVLNSYELDLKTIKIRFLIDLAFFELKNQDFDVANERIVEINEIVQEMSDLNQYLWNDVLNLMAASAQLKKDTKKRDVIEDLEKSLPKRNIEPLATPETKPPRLPKLSKNIVEKEELHQKRIDLNVKLDLNDDENDFEEPKINTRTARKDDFKVKKPIVPKPALEEATPRPSCSKPRFFVTEPSVDMATLAQANKKNLDLSTSIESTPEQFFTPLSFIKTYPKKSFRHNIVKNLEEEFSTPRSSTDKDNRNETEMKGIPAEKPGKSLIKEAKVKGDMLKEVKSKVREETPKVKEEKLKIKEEKDENATGKGRISRTAAKDLMNVPGISRTRKDNKRTLIRAVSPGKMKTRKDDKK